jgi:hypothetical protein
MQIAILSDIHDHVWNLAKALKFIGNAGALIVCGDLCSPFIISQLGEGFTGPIHIVFGNNDGDTFRMTRNASRYTHLKLHGELYEAELDGIKVAANHYPEIASPLAQSGKYEVVCYGHNHAYAMQHQSGVFLLNPGAVMGYDPIQSLDVPPSLILFDTQRKQAQGYRLTAGGDWALVETLG